VKLSVAEIVVAVLIAAAGVGVYVYAHRDEPAIERTKERGDAIVAALEAHRAIAGRYPDSLPQLVPEPLDSLPAPAWGGGWSYHTFDDGAHAELYVRKDRLTLRYDFSSGRWALDN
jgi:hypothetical protein